MSRYLKVWENYHKFADERGWLVANILQQFTSLNEKKVLDFGCGNGGTSQIFAKLGADVTAVDIKPEIEQALQNSGVTFIHAKNENRYLNKRKYDIVILQDVLEHLPNPEKLMKQMKDALCPLGLIYISTPNRFSLLNLISDPHWNLPGVALLSRQAVSFFVQKIFRRDLRKRTDWAALLSLNKLKKLLMQNDFEIFLLTTSVAKLLFQNPCAIVCHPLHIRLVQWMKRHRLEKWIYQWVNDRAGWFNCLINPTWYVIGRAK